MGGRFETLDSDIMTIIMTMMSNQNLCKLIYYDTSTPLLEANIENTTSLLFDRLYPIPITPLVTDDAKSFITVVLDDFQLGKTNIKFKTSKILINVISHISLWPIAEGKLRPYGIMGEIDKLFNEQRIVGIGKLIFERSNWIAANEKFMGYRLVYNVVEFN